MHHGHFDLAIFLIVVVAVLLVTAAALWGSLKLRKRVFAGPARDQWVDAGRDLSRRDKLRVQWSTQRKRPVDRADLAPAQLAFIRYAVDSGRRSPLIRRGRVRMAFIAFYVVLAAVEITLAVAQHPVQIAELVIGVLFAIVAVMWAFFIPRSVTRQTGRLEELRDEVEKRHGGQPAGAGTS